MLFRSYAVLCYAMLCYAVLCYAMLCYAVLCYAVPCCAVLCYAMLCYAMLCYAMLCRAVPCCAQSINTTDAQLIYSHSYLHLLHHILSSRSPYVQVLPNTILAKEKSKRTFWGPSLKTSREKEKETSRNRDTSQVPPHSIISYLIVLYWTETYCHHACIHTHNYSLIDSNSE